MYKYQILINNNKTNESRFFYWILDWSNNYEDEIKEYIDHMINYNQKDDGEDSFWMNSNFEDYSWLVSID